MGRTSESSLLSIYDVKVVLYLECVGILYLECLGILYLEYVVSLEEN